MKKMFAYLDKIGADYRREKFGADYFFNAPGVVYDGAVVCFEYDRYDPMTVAQKEKLVRRYAARYGYQIFNDGCFPGCSYFSVARSDDREKASDYYMFRDNSVSECEQIIHNAHIGKFPADMVEKKLREIMDYYGSLYNDFCRAIMTA